MGSVGAIAATVPLRIPVRLQIHCKTSLGETVHVAGDSSAFGNLFPSVDQTASCIMSFISYFTIREFLLGLIHVLNAFNRKLEFRNWNRFTNFQWRISSLEYNCSSSSSNGSFLQVLHQRSAMSGIPFPSKEEHVSDRNWIDYLGSRQPQIHQCVWGWNERSRWTISNWRRSFSRTHCEYWRGMAVLW